MVLDRSLAGLGITHPICTRLRGPKCHCKQHTLSARLSSSSRGSRWKRAYLRFHSGKRQLRYIISTTAVFQTPLDASFVKGIWIPSWKMLEAAVGREPGTAPPLSVIFGNKLAQTAQTFREAYVTKIGSPSDCFILSAPPAYGKNATLTQFLVPEDRHKDKPIVEVGD